MSKLKNKPDHDGFNPYGIDKLANIKPGVKIGFMKFWFSGAAFFVTFTALSIDTYDVLDRFVLLVLILTLAVEFISNKVIIWMNNDKTPTLKYLPFYIKRSSILSILASMGFVIVMVICSVYFVELMMLIGIPSIGMLMFGFENRGIDPITFGIVYLLMDYLWITVKNLILKKIKK
jgi:uncharacterized membrane protein